MSGWPRSLSDGIRRVLPRPVLEALRGLRRRLRRVGYQASRVSGRRVGREDIVRVLRELGISPGADVMLHSSMRSVGVIEGGADAVLGAFLSVIGSTGTLLAPAYPLTGTMIEHLERGGIALDVRSTPSTMGRISETLRLQAGSHRSLHPTHSVVGLGARAAYYCEGHDRSGSPCGAESPFVKLVDRRGWIVAFGSGIGKVTSYHVLEDRVSNFPVPVYLAREYRARVVDAAGIEREVPVRCHDPRFSRVRIDNDAGVERRFERLLADRGVLVSRALGTGRVSAMRADALETALEDLLRDGITIYDLPCATAA